ncbi:alpha/beta hydrolase [Streptomyces phaeochromogenes]|uniref:Alpha/beta hydrolase n=1 Tax=Streptomyces phaeochromogenes TaxID=1923 RepID=A0ABZ1H734_STRPH|nr:alpha/beta hydrolase [Streptomyces phaeochromogenes]WSD14369.1 alpha/beta hydrolase [Streptomyces phaeochromogenes]
MKIRVSFPSSNLKIAGVLFVPDTYTGEPLPAVVVGHPAGGVKEQTASIYAEHLSRAGFAALVFDAAYQGESEGEPRYLEDPFQRAEDVRAAVSFLSARSDIDPERIGGLGICASGGYVSFAAQTDRRIKAVATVSAVDISVLVFGGSGDDQNPELRDELLRQAGAQRNAEARGLGSTSVSPVPALASDVPNFPPRSMFGEAYEYYRGPRGNHPNSRNWMVPRLDAFAQFAAFAHQHWISPRPLLMIVGSDADTRGLSDAAVARAAEPKELFEIDGASHIDMYDQPEYVLPAVAKLTDFFGKHLNA